ncbi:MAG: hypothetical protein HQK75_16280 [Candidatus Magnetomorum sp.]|nr:hypothetical protein [Candidatus Magnetomorum sp.]
MKKITYLLMIVIWMSGTAFAGLTRIQTIDIHAGWNAIFLEVEPDQPDPDLLFAETSIKQVLAYYTKISPVQYIQSPDEIEFKQNGWYRWVPSEHPESILNNLHRLQANHAYLVFSETNYTWNLTGTPFFQNRIWQPDSFNFTGFHVDPQAPPTFFQFFEGSKSHEKLIIYTLNQNNWEKIEYPSETNITSGKAYWVYCTGGSEYQGPMKIILPSPDNALSYYLTNPLYEIRIVNQSPNPLSFTMMPLLNTNENNTPVPLSIIIYSDTMQKGFEPFTAYTPENSIEAGDFSQIKLAIRRKEINQDSVSNLLKIMDDVGDVFYVKVWAENIRE